MFSLTEKCFPLTNFPNSKQTQESLKNNFLKTTFQKTNIVLVIEYFPLEIFNGYFPSLLWLEITNEICYLTNSVDI